eukprot:scaffold97418_cov29-Tisochrysis_lutea.AAC.3
MTGSFRRALWMARRRGSWPSNIPPPRDGDRQTELNPGSCRTARCVQGGASDHLWLDLEVLGAPVPCRRHPYK